jgi:hypothetical protein
VGAYVIVYSVENDDDVLVLRVVDRRRDLEPLFGPLIAPHAGTDRPAKLHQAGERLTESSFSRRAPTSKMGPYSSSRAML